MNKKKNISLIFFIFLFSHMAIWTIIPTLTNVNLPLDTIEALAWGSDLNWGFNKHPPLSALMVEIFYQIFGNQDWSYYFLSQIFVVITFFIIWVFSKDFFSNKLLSLISVLFLEGIYFYNYTTPEFNVYVCELPFWALTVLYCWRGIKNNKKEDWLFFGLFAALGTLSHYLFLYLITALSILLIYFLSKKVLNYLCFISMAIFLLAISPHLIWLQENEYITLSYAFHRTGLQEMNFYNHIIHPVTFLIKQIGIIVPSLAMLLTLCSKFKSKFNFKDKKFLFLLSINLTPIILIFFTSMIFGVKIRTMWMTPFYLFLGVFIVYLFQKRINLLKLNKFFVLFFFFFILSPVTYLSVSLSQDNKRTDYPGKEIARLVQNKWDENFTNKIKIVVGDEWAAGNLSYHLNSRPTWKQSLQGLAVNIGANEGVIYTGNPKILKEICPGFFGTIRPLGYCMIGQK